MQQRKLERVWYKEGHGKPKAQENGKGKAHMPTIGLGGADIPYMVIRHPRRRHVYVEVRPGQVVVRVPLRFANRQIPAIFSQHSEWIRKQLAAFEVVQAQTSRKYVTGELFPYLGKTYVLNVDYGEDASKSSVKLTGGHLCIVITRPNPDGVEEEGPSDARDLILQWYRERAKEYLPARLDELSQETGMRPARVRVKNQVTRWGSCSSSGSVNLNWRLVLAPTRVADYVIVHELCHLKVPNHSKRFWNLLATVDPRFPEWKLWLKVNSWLLKSWLHDE